MEIANVILDFILVAAAVWMIVTVRSSGLGGVFGKTLTAVSTGAVILGIAHLIETAMFEWLGMEAALVELIHRILILAGFVLLIYGFQSLATLRLSK